MCRLEPCRAICLGSGKGAGNCTKCRTYRHTQPFVGWAKGRLLIAPRAGLTAGEFENALKPHNGKSRIHLKKLNVHIVELPEGADEVEVMRELKK